MSPGTLMQKTRSPSSLKLSNISNNIVLQLQRVNIKPNDHPWYNCIEKNI